MRPQAPLWVAHSLTPLPPKARSPSLHRGPRRGQRGDFPPRPLPTPVRRPSLIPPSLDGFLTLPPPAESPYRTPALTCLRSHSASSALKRGRNSGNEHTSRSRLSKQEALDPEALPAFGCTRCPSGDGGGTGLTNTWGQWEPGLPTGCAPMAVLFLMGRRARGHTHTRPRGSMVSAPGDTTSQPNLHKHHILTSGPAKPQAWWVGVLQRFQGDPTSGRWGPRWEEAGRVCTPVGRTLGEGTLHVPEPRAESRGPHCSVLTMALPHHQSHSGDLC